MTEAVSIQLYDPRQSDGWSPECDLLVDGLTELEAARLYEFAKRLYKVFYDENIRNRESRILNAIKRRSDLHRTVFNHLGSLIYGYSSEDGLRNESGGGISYFSGMSGEGGLRTDEAPSALEAYRRSINCFSSDLQQWCAVIDRAAEEGLDVLVSETETLSSFQEFYLDLYNLMFTEHFDTTIVLSEDVGSQAVGSNGVTDICIESKDYMFCKTIPIVLSSSWPGNEEDSCGFTVDLGPMYMYLISDTSLTRALSSPGMLSLGVRAAAERPAMAHGHYHPHVGSGVSSPRPNQICLGEAQAPIRSALARGTVSDLMFITFAVLNSYNSEGAYVSLESWYDGDFCSVCNAPLIGDDLVVCALSGDTLHRGCTVELPDVGRVSAALTWSCRSCGSIEHGDCPRHDSICETCCGLLDEEEAAAQAGEFVCPNCRTRHTSVSENRIVINNGYVVCSACASQLEDHPGFAGYIIRQHNPNGTVEEVTAMVNQFHPVYSNRPTPEPARRERCDCGALSPIYRIARDEFTGSRYCPSCDPDRLGFSPQFFQDMGYLEGWLECFKLSNIDDFTQDFLSGTMSFLAYDFSLETAGAVVRKLRQWEMSCPARYDSRTTRLADKAAFWQDIISDITEHPFLIYFSEGEELHDQTQEAQWGRPVEATQSEEVTDGGDSEPAS